MRVTLLSEKAPDRPHNEDGAFHAGNLVGVLDGVSTPQALDTGCVHGTAWFVKRLIARLQESYLAHPSASLCDILASAIDAVRPDHGGQCDLDHTGTPAAAVGLLRLQPPRTDYLILCDVTLLFDDGGTVQVFTDNRFDSAMADIRAKAFADRPRLGSDDQLSRTNEAALARQQFTNRVDGYWIAAANPEAARHAVAGSIQSPGSTRTAVLMTDGAADAVDRYALLDWSALVPLLRNAGPASLMRKIRDAESADSDGRRQPRYKRHDDATIAFCELDEEDA